MSAATESIGATGSATQSRRWVRVFLMYILPPLIALAVVLVPTLSSAAILPRISVSPGFALIDQQGETVTNESLHGDIVLFSLASLACDENCTETLATMRAVHDEWTAGYQGESDEPRLRLVTIIVDGVEDPAALASFAASHGIDGTEWSVLSGNEVAVRAVVGSGFGVYLGRNDDGAPVHDPGVFLTDHAGFLRAEYRTGTPGANAVSGDIDAILAEANAGAVGGLLYNAAHSLSLSCGG